MRTASRREHYYRAGFKQEAPLKGSLIEGAESKGSIPNLEKGESIKAEALQVKFSIMKQAVASNPKVNFKCMGRNMASLFNSESMVSLVQQNYFERNIKPQLEPSRGPEANLHNLLDLKGVNGAETPLTRYFKMCVAFLELKIPKVGFLVVKDPSDLLETKKTKLPGIMGWDLIRLAYKDFTEKHPTEVFNSFNGHQMWTHCYSCSCVFTII